MKIKMKKTQNINENTESIFKKSVYLKMKHSFERWSQWILKKLTRDLLVVTSLF